MPTTTNFGIFYWASLDPASADIWQDAVIDALVAIDAQLATRSAAYDFDGEELQKATMVNSGEKLNALGNQSGAVAINYTSGQYATMTATGNISSITVSNWRASGTPSWMTIEITQDGTGGRTLTLGSAYKTPNGSGITLSTGAGDVDTLHLFTRDGGTTIYVIANLNWS
jgi:hypothetical protein